MTTPFDDVAAQAADNSARLVARSLMPIYRIVHANKVEGVGSGFLLRFENRPLLITAKHCLYGESGTEMPSERILFVEDRAITLADMNAEIFKANECDLAALFVDSMDLERCLSLDVLDPSSGPTSLITIHGFLARDFKSKGEVLMPKPFLFTFPSLPHAEGFVAMQWPKGAIDTGSGEMGQTSKPRGLSGCPMMSTVALAMGRIEVLGVFTDKPPLEPKAFGEASNKVRALLRLLEGR